MPIRSIRVDDVMVFQRSKCVDEAFEMSFSDGINVLIGENGIGKTALLKMIYAAAQWSVREPEPGRRDSLARYFSFHLRDRDLLRDPECTSGDCGFSVSDGVHTVSYSISRNAFSGLEDWRGRNNPSVFIPSSEFLTHSKGLLALYQKYTNLGFDQTEVDILVKASLPEVREVPEHMKPILEKLSDAVGGTVVQEDGTFYICKRDGRTVDSSLEAEGACKMGLLWKLIRNGLLQEGTVLLWDEPEASMNPDLFPLAAEVLLALQKSDVQVLLATHSYNLAKYLEILRRSTEQVRFHNLYRKGPGGAVRSTSADTLQGLGPNSVMMADLRLLDMVYDL